MLFFVFSHFLLGVPIFVVILTFIYKFVLSGSYRKSYSKLFQLDYNKIIPHPLAKYVLREKDYTNYQAIKNGMKSRAGIMQRNLILTDLELIKAVNVKDFNHFTDRHPRLENANPVMNNMLSFQTGDDWKRLRGILGQAFSSGRIRRVYHSFHTTGKKLVEFLRAQAEPDVEIVGPVNKYLLELISTSVFGLESQIFSSDTPTPFEIYTKEIQKAMVRHRQARLIPGLLRLCNFLRINVIRPDPKALEFFRNTIENTIKTRKTAGKTCDDLLQLLMESQSTATESDPNLQEINHNHNSNSNASTQPGKLTDEMILSQACMFFFAGTEGPATLLIYGLYELALNPEIQDKLYKEVRTAMESSASADGHCMDYDTIVQLPYLDMFVSEVLRMYSSGITARRCGKKYKVPGTEIVVEAGANVHTPLYGIHHDEEYYPNPFKFNPDHFTPEAKANRNHFAYMPFGIGPRSCIAQRFGLVQGKTAISHMVYNFKFEPSNKTESPPKGSIESLFLPINGLWLRLEDRIRKKELN